MKARLLFSIAMLVAVPLHAQTSKPRTTPKPTTSTQRQTPRTDIPSANVNLTFYLIQADGFQNDDAEIRPIVTELRKVFKFSGYRLASKSVLRSAPWNGGQAKSSQVVMDPEGLPYYIEAWVGANADESAFLAVKLYSGTMQTANGLLIDASVKVHDGKTVVVGSAMGGKDKAIILAVTPGIEK